MPYIKLSRSALLLLPSILFITGCRSAYNYFEKGDTAFARGKYAEASLDYRKAAQKDPAFGDAYYKAGLAELQQNEAAQALQDLQTAVRLMPDNQAAKTELTNLMLGAYVGDPKRPKFLYDLLVRLSSEWLKRDPNSLQGLRIKGYLAMLEQRPEEAVELFRRAHQAAPRDEKIMDGLLDALFRANEPAEAEKVALDFLGTDSGASDVYDALYRMYLGAQRTADAEIILKRKVNANRKVHAYVLQLAAFYARQHRTSDVDETVRMYLNDRDNNPAARLEAGDFYTSIGDLAAALEQYRSASNSANKDKSVYQNRMARVLLLQNKKQEGLAVLNQTLARDPNNDEARALRAAVLVGAPGAGKPGEGVQELRALLDKNPDDLFLKFLLARALAERHDYAESRKRLMEIVKLRPEFLDAHILLADIAFKQRDLLETVHETGIALEMDTGESAGAHAAWQRAARAGQPGSGRRGAGQSFAAGSRVCGGAPGTGLCQPEPAPLRGGGSRLQQDTGGPSQGSAGARGIGGHGSGAGSRRPSPGASGRRFDKIAWFAGHPAPAGSHGAPERKI